MQPRRFGCGACIPIFFPASAMVCVHSMKQHSTASNEYPLLICFKMFLCFHVLSLPLWNIWNIRCAQCKLEGEFVITYRSCRVCDVWLCDLCQREHEWADNLWTNLSLQSRHIPLSYRLVFSVWRLGWGLTVELWCVGVPPLFFLYSVVFDFFFSPAL